MTPAIVDDHCKEPDATPSTKPNLRVRQSNPRYQEKNTAQLARKRKAPRDMPVKVAEMTSCNQFVDDHAEESDATPTTKPNLHARQSNPRHEENTAQLARKRKASWEPALETHILGLKTNPRREPETVKEFVRVL